MQLQPTLQYALGCSFAHAGTEGETPGGIGVAQADFKNGKVSIFSPVAAALIGYGVNDEIDWIVPSGMTKIIIDEIIYQPEAAGDFDL